MDQMIWALIIPAFFGLASISRDMHQAVKRLEGLRDAQLAIANALGEIANRQRGDESADA